MSAFFLTRLNVGDYDAWKPAFDQDLPRAREAAKGHRIFRNIEEPDEVYILVEFASQDDAEEGRKRLLVSEVLDRFADKDLPKIVEEAASVSY
jgi:hypothetical protein